MTRSLRVLLFAGVLPFSFTLDAAVPSGFSDVAVTSVTAPTAIAFTPDGRLLITQQSGSLRVYSGGALLTAPAITFPSMALCTNTEQGLLGVAVDPAFASNGYLYLYRTFKKAGGSCVNRVARFTMSGNTVSAASELVLVDNIPSPAGNHNGGDLQFGKDGFLYISIGDGGCDYNGGGCAGSNDASRDQNVLLGKVLRITTAGGIPATNPFQGTDSARCNVNGSTTAAKCQETFAWGFRNPFRMAMDPNAAATRLFVNDVGQGAWEEIDLAQSGGDFGWNCREGAHTNSTSGLCNPAPANMIDPLFEYSHSGNVPGTSVGGCGSITGGAFVPNGIWPGYDGTYLFSDYNCGAIFRLSPTFSASTFATALGSSSAVHLLFGPWNSTQALYYTTYAGGGSVRRVQYNNPSGNNPPDAVAGASPLTGAAPLTVTLSAAGSSDPDAGNTLTYFWTFGDGTPETSTTSTTIQHTYATGTYTASLRVRDNHFAFSSPDTVTIVSGNTPPAPSITAPAAGTLFSVGQSLTLTGNATDPEDGTLPASSLSWTILQHHDAHTHPFLGPTSGNNINFTAPAPEDLAAALTSYLEIRLTATDSAGVSSTVVRNLDPRKVALSFDTNPSRMTVRVNNLDFVTPATVTSWANWQLPIAAFAQTLFGADYTFASWSDGGAQTHSITTPASATSYLARFTPGDGTDYHALVPCRVVDTRGGTPLSDGTRNFAIAGNCGIPITASAVAIIITAVSPTTNGYLESYPAGYTRPNTSTLAIRANRTRASNTIAALGTNGEITVTTSIGGGTAHLIVDVVGYFE
ncbi:MAG TPA: PQQ-dependent sugar dehydrogenase [Thermoanaerobaculia bacterium]|nr:PQQ-dependent sugar dehydrogenase [Thermoanaerobaculia bacterium]